MTIRTSLVWQWIRHFGFMARPAVDRFVPALQLISGEHVIERFRIQLFLEGFFRMALFAFHPKPGFVHILMACRAGVEILVFVVLENLLRAGVALHLVARRTIQFLVLPDQGKSGLGMIKCVFPNERGKGFLRMALLA